MYHASRVPRWSGWVCFNNVFFFSSWSLPIPEQYAFQYSDYNLYITEEVSSFLVLELSLAICIVNYDYDYYDYNFYLIIIFIIIIISSNSSIFTCSIN